MQNIPLLNSTGNQRVDNILRGVIGIFETVFPDRIRGYYLVGSYADGTAISTSDIDMKILFKNRFRDNIERKNSQQICEYCFGLISPIVQVMLPQRTKRLLFQPARFNFGLKQEVSWYTVKIFGIKSHYIRLSFIRVYGMPLRVIQSTASINRFKSVCCRYRCQDRF